MSGAEQPLGRHLRPDHRQHGQRPKPELDLQISRPASSAERRHYHRATKATRASNITKLRSSCITAFWERTLRTSGRSPYHATLVGLSPDDASRLLSPPVPNPRGRDKKEPQDGKTKNLCR